jgi:H+/Cl- antiporter ClcA
MLAVAERGGRIRPQVALVKSLASALCIGSGGSAGREGPIVQIGSALGSTWLGLAAGGLVLGLLLLALPQLYGVGYPVLEGAIRGQHTPAWLLIFLIGPTATLCTARGPPWWARPALTVWLAWAPSLPQPRGRR